MACVACWLTLPPVFTLGALNCRESCWWSCGGLVRSQALVDGKRARARGHVHFGFPVAVERLTEHLHKTIGSDHYPIAVTVDFSA